MPRWHIGIDLWVTWRLHTTYTHIYTYIYILFLPFSSLKVTTAVWMLRSFIYIPTSTYALKLPNPMRRAERIKQQCLRKIWTNLNTISWELVFVLPLYTWRNAYGWPVTFPNTLFFYATQSKTLYDHSVSNIGLFFRIHPSSSHKHCKISNEKDTGKSKWKFEKKNNICWSQQNGQT